MSQFQIILTTVFGFFIIIGVIMFAGFKGQDAPGSVEAVVIWGTLDEQVMKATIGDLQKRDNKFEKVKYEQISENDFDKVLAERMAEGTGPDVFLLPQSKILKHQNKILLIPYEAFSVRNFKDYFIEEGELYLDDGGILALPFIIDPLVMYWNRNIFTRIGIPNPPAYWDNFFAFAIKAIEKDKNKNILTSAVALGEYENISNAKEILATLIMQTGNPIVVKNKQIMDVVLRDASDKQTTATESALRFYTEFSNPVKETYSWNKSMSDSKNAFLAGDLAIYFGFASELKELQNKNPNLNFDVSVMPQVSGAKNNINFGKMQGLAINKGSKNLTGAFSVISALITTETLTYLSQMTNLPPVSKIILAREPTDPYQNIFFRAALSSKAFLDLDEDTTDLIFQDMVESVVSGRRILSDAVSRADAEMAELLK
ncbi:MAG: extracellular solute-binding protein [Patescibacteria group bacterium]